MASKIIDVPATCVWTVLLCRRAPRALNRSWVRYPFTWFYMLICLVLIGLWFADGAIVAQVYQGNLAWQTYLSQIRWTQFAFTIIFFVLFFIRLAYVIVLSEFRTLLVAGEWVWAALIGLNLGIPWGGLNYPSWGFAAAPVWYLISYELARTRRVMEPRTATQVITLFIVWIMAYIILFAGSWYTIEGYYVHFNLGGTFGYITVYASFYYATMALTTIGFGDVVSSNNSARGLTILFVIIFWSVSPILLSNLIYGLNTTRGAFVSQSIRHRPLDVVKENVIIEENTDFDVSPSQLGSHLHFSSSPAPGTGPDDSGDTGSGMGRTPCPEMQIPTPGPIERLATATPLFQRMFPRFRVAPPVPSVILHTPPAPDLAALEERASEAANKVTLTAFSPVWTVLLVIIPDLQPLTPEEETGALTRVLSNLVIGGSDYQHVCRPLRWASVVNYGQPYKILSHMRVLLVTKTVPTRQFRRFLRTRPFNKVVSVAVLGAFDASSLRNAGAGAADTAIIGSVALFNAECGALPPHSSSVVQVSAAVRRACRPNTNVEVLVAARSAEYAAQLRGFDVRTVSHQALNAAFLVTAASMPGAGTLLTVLSQPPLPANVRSQCTVDMLSRALISDGLTEPSVEHQQLHTSPGDAARSFRDVAPMPGQQYVHECSDSVFLLEQRIHPNALPLFASRGTLRAYIDGVGSGCFSMPVHASVAGVLFTDLVALVTRAAVLPISKEVAKAENAARKRQIDQFLSMERHKSIHMSLPALSDMNAAEGYFANEAALYYNRKVWEPRAVFTPFGITYIHKSEASMFYDNHECSAPLVIGVGDDSGAHIVAVTGIIRNGITYLMPVAMKVQLGDVLVVIAQSRLVGRVALRRASWFAQRRPLRSPQIRMLAPAVQSAARRGAMSPRPAERVRAMSHICALQPPAITVTCHVHKGTECVHACHDDGTSHVSIAEIFGSEDVGSPAVVAATVAAVLSNEDLSCALSPASMFDGSNFDDAYETSSHCGEMHSRLIIPSHHRHMRESESAPSTVTSVMSVPCVEHVESIELFQLPPRSSAPCEMTLPAILTSEHSHASTVSIVSTTSAHTSNQDTISSVGSGQGVLSVPAVAAPAQPPSNAPTLLHPACDVQNVNAPPGLDTDRPPGDPAARPPTSGQPNDNTVSCFSIPMTHFESPRSSRSSCTSVTSTQQLLHSHIHPKPICIAPQECAAFHMLLSRLPAADITAVKGTSISTLAMVGGASSLTTHALAAACWTRKTVFIPPIEHDDPNQPDVLLPCGGHLQDIHHVLTCTQCTRDANKVSAAVSELLRRLISRWGIPSAVIALPVGAPADARAADASTLLCVLATHAAMPAVSVTSCLHSQTSLRSFAGAQFEFLTAPGAIPRLYDLQSLPDMADPLCMVSPIVAEGVAIVASAAADTAVQNARAPGTLGLLAAMAGLRREDVRTPGTRKLGKVVGEVCLAAELIGDITSCPNNGPDPPDKPKGQEEQVYEPDQQSTRTTHPTVFMTPMLRAFPVRTIVTDCGGCLSAGALSVAVAAAFAHRPPVSVPRHLVDAVAAVITACCDSIVSAVLVGIVHRTGISHTAPVCPGVARNATINTSPHSVTFICPPPELSVGPDDLGLIFVGDCAHHRALSCDLTFAEQALIFSGKSGIMNLARDKNSCQSSTSSASAFRHSACHSSRRHGYQRNSPQRMADAVLTDEETQVMVLGQARPALVRTENMASTGGSTN